MNLNGSQVDFLLAFLGGIAVSFTPCVYPLIPITIGVIGKEATTCKVKGFTCSLIFVSGVALTYASLGMIAALTGKYFGKATSSPLFDFFVGLAVIVFALSMFDIFKIHVKFTLKPSLGKGDVISVFLMGIISGIAIGPCTAPALSSIITYASTKQNLFYAVFLLMSFAYGMGLILILAGTFSGVILNIPKPGKWMEKVKRILGFALLLWGGYFIVRGIGRM